MPVQRTGKGLRDHMKRILDEVESKEVQVGFFESSAYEDGTPVAYVAAIQEFGYPEGNIPARPFIRPTVAEQREAWRKTLQQGFKAAINERITVMHMLEQFGMAAAGQVKITISKITDPPLSAATLAARQSRKKTDGVSTKPLVDTGLLISSVQSAVVDR